MIISSRLEQAALETLAADPVTAVVTGRVYWNSVSKTVRIWDGTVWTDLVGANGATLKDIDGGAALDTRRLTIPKAAKAALVALTRKQGTIVFASDENLMYYDNGAALVAFGTSLSGQSQWDEINGGVGPKSFYSNVNYATAAAATYNDVVILGNLTLNHDWVALGDVFVSGQIISNGFKLTVDGDLTALGGGACAGANVSWVVRGEFFTGADWVCTNSSASQPSFTVGKEFTAFDVATGLAKAVTMNGLVAAGVVAAPGYILRVGGNLNAGAVNLSGGTFGTNAAGGSGGQLIVGGSLGGVGTLSLDGAAGNGTGAAGAGGTLTVGGDTRDVGAVSAVGGASGVGSGLAGGAGGTLTAKGDFVVTSAAVAGGAGDGVGAGGAGGTLAVNGNVIFTGTLTLSGGSAGTGAAAAGGAAGSATIDGSAVGMAVTANGGNGGNSGLALGGNGGSVTVRGLVACNGRAWSSQGGSPGGTSTGRAGNGGSLTLDSGGAVGSIDLRGGLPTATSLIGSAGGGVTVATGSLYVGGAVRLDAAVGSGAGLTSGGAAGSLSVAGDFLCTGVFSSAGSDGLTVGGGAGFLQVGGNCRIGSTLTLRGGDTSATSGAATGGGVAVGVLIGGDLYVAGLVTVRGGDAFNAGLTTGVGGAGDGTSTSPRFTVGGDMRLVAASGRHIIRGGDGKGGAGTSALGIGLRVYGFTLTNTMLTFRGGDNRTAATVVGVPGRLALLGGCSMAQLEAFGTDVRVGAAGTTVGFSMGGWCTFGYISLGGYGLLPLVGDFTSTFAQAFFSCGNFTGSISSGLTAGTLNSSGVYYGVNIGVLTGAWNFKIWNNT